MPATENGSDRTFVRLAWAVLVVGASGTVAYAFAPSSRVADILYYSVGTVALGLGWIGILRRVAAAPAQAIELAAQVEFDLLVTDVVLPGMDGQRLAAELRSRKRELRVVYVSGYPRDGLVESELNQGTRFLQKPYSTDELSRTVRGALDSNLVADVSR
jgi:CheY-like chemotaxis protein